MRFTMHPDLPAVDVQRARASCRDELGVDPVTVDGEPFDPRLNQEFEEMLLDTGAAKFGVCESRHAGRNQATAARIVTDDFDAPHAELVARGVEFVVSPIAGKFGCDDGPPPFWEGGALVFPDGERTAWFKDSEGDVSRPRLVRLRP